MSGQHMTKVGEGKRVSSNGYEAKVSYYQAQRCEQCPLRGMCHQSKGNRKIEVNYRLNELKSKVRELLTSEQGKAHRSKRPVEVEAVFGQLKSNNKFNRFTMRGMEKVTLEFMLMAMGHNLRKMASKMKKETPSTIFDYNITFIVYRIAKKEQCKHKIIELHPKAELISLVA
jgi:hypothetical protein